MFYIFNLSNNCIGCCDRQPDADDLKSRSEMSVESDTIYDISSIVLTDGAIAQKPAVVLTAGEIKANKIAILDAEYQPQFAELAQSLGLATLDGNQTIIDGIKSDYSALKKVYNTKREAIV